MEAEAGEPSRGAVRLSATVTVHRTALDAAWEQARMLEEDLDCAEQTQRPGERLTGLQSLSFARGEGGNTSGDDLLLETRQCVSDTRGGPYPYWWQQAVLGSVVAGTSVCGGRRRSEEELNSLVAEVLPRMLLRVEQEIGESGGATAVLYRTVHEPPDPTGLDQLPPPLRAVIDGCLTKDPALRPTAAAVHSALRDNGPSTAPDWLPPAVLRLVAERSARALDPPPRTAGPSAPEPPNTPMAQGFSRRRILTIGSSAAAVLAASGTGATVLLTRGHTATSGSPRSAPTRTIALHADLTSSQKALGKAQERGALLAVAAHNAREDVSYRLALSSYDDGGSAAGARETAGRVLAAPSVGAVIGPSTTAGARAAVPLYAAASMPVVLVSVADDAAGLSTTTLRTLCMTRASDSSQALPILFYLTRTRPSRRTAVVQDGAAGETAVDISRNLVETPPSGGTVTVHQVAADKDDFGPVVAQALATHPQAVVYGGTSPRRAAACARALAAARFTGAVAGFEPVMRADFLGAAGQAAEGWVFEAPYTEAQSAGTTAAKAFTAAYRTRYGAPPGRWSAEAYDAVGLIARALDALGATTTIEPAQIAERLFHNSYDGVAKSIRFVQGTTHAMDPENTGFLYQVKDGAFRFLGRYDQVRSSQPQADRR